VSDNTDDASVDHVLIGMRRCAKCWEGDARLLGNIRAKDMIRALDAALATMGSSSLIEELEAAIKALDSPFLALPEDGHTLESLAYRRGAKDAYQNVVNVLKGWPPQP
jgi:hypothetical protein